MKIHHIGYLVDSIANASIEFEKLGFSRISEVVDDKLRETYILFLANEEHIVELIQPINKESPLYGLSRKYRNSPYHICYETVDLYEKIEQMVHNETGGYTVIQMPQPAPAIQNCPNVAFLMNRYIGMIELLEIRR